MKGAELFVRCLENEGVEYVFGIPGEENLDVMDALLDSSIKFITVRHEQGAAFMADVYGRLTERAGVCLSTLGPGATNLITGVADANMDHAPLVAIAGQAGTNRLHKESHQVLELTKLFQPVTKYATSLLEPEIIPEVVRKAFKVAQTEKTGATFIEFPENVAGMEVTAAPLPVTHPPDPEPPADQRGRESRHPRRKRSGALRCLEAAGELCRQAEYPGRQHLHGQGRDPVPPSLCAWQRRAPVK